MTWNDDELTTLASPDELRISSRRKDGTYSRPVIVWAVRAGDGLYVRSVYGDKPWYRSVRLRGAGRVTAGGLTRDVVFTTPVSEGLDAVDDAYRATYAHYPSIVPMCVNDLARSHTIRIDPA